ncbi:MAG: RNA methyltransferase [Desulfurococcaceae archaeon]
MWSSDIFLEFSRIYGSMTSYLLDQLKKPPRRLYARINTLKASRPELLKMLENEGIEAYPDEYIDDAIYFEVEGPHPISCDTDKYVIVDAKTAVSLILGANLYKPGVVKSSFFNEGDIIVAMTTTGLKISCLKATVSSRKLSMMSKGLIGVNISSPYKAPKISETKVYRNGYIYMQSLPSILTTHVLKPSYNDLIVDMNAAPGGKTSHIVQLTRGHSRIIAFDRNRKKIEELIKTLETLSLNINVFAIPYDSRYIHMDFDLKEKADKVLIDPPCSNLGVRPLIEIVRSIKDIENLSKYQKQFIKTAWHILKPGGLLVYSTCTLTFKENEENILYAVETLGFQSIEASEHVPYAEKISYKGIVSYRFSPLANDMPGYFISLLVKP